MLNVTLVINCGTTVVGDKNIIGCGSATLDRTAAARRAAVANGDAVATAAMNATPVVETTEAVNTPEVIHSIETTVDTAATVAGAAQGGVKRNAEEVCSSFLSLIVLNPSSA